MDIKLSYFLLIRTVSCMKLKHDFYHDIASDVKKRFHTSDYPEKHESGIKTGVNKKVIGKF